MDIEISADRIIVESGSQRKTIVHLINIDESEILNHFSISHIIDNFKDRDILEAIGQRACEEYFSLQPKE